MLLLSIASIVTNYRSHGTNKFSFNCISIKVPMFVLFHYKIYDMVDWDKTKPGEKCAVCYKRPKININVLCNCDHNLLHYLWFILTYMHELWFCLTGQLSTICCNFMCKYILTLCVSEYGKFIIRPFMYAVDTNQTYIIKKSNFW